MTTSTRPKAAPLVRLLPMIDRDTATGCWNYTGYIIRPDGRGRDCKACRSMRARGKGRSFESAPLLRDVRIVRGWTQDEIAEYVGVGRASIQRIEQGRNSEVDGEVFELLDALLDEFRLPAPVSA